MPRSYEQPTSDPLPELTRAIEQLREKGATWGWPAEDMASIAYRRWRSHDRRHKKSKATTRGDRIRDLAKGLQAHYEPGKLYTPWAEWEYLAQQLAAVLESD